MTYQTAYTQTLYADAALGLDYSYAVAIPATGQGGATARVTLRGPAQGQARFSSVHIPIDVVLEGNAGAVVVVHDTGTGAAVNLEWSE